MERGIIGISHISHDVNWRSRISPLSQILSSRPRGVAMDFWEGGRIVESVANLPQKYPKIGKDTRFGPLHSRIWRGRLS